MVEPTMEKQAEIKQAAIDKLLDKGIKALQGDKKLYSVELYITGLAGVKVTRRQGW